MSENKEVNPSRFLEAMIIVLAKDRKVPVISHERSRRTDDLFANRLLIKHPPYVNCFGQTRRSGFILRNGEQTKDIRIECFWQQNSGSTYEKLPLIFLNFRKHMPQREIVFLIDGGAIPDGAMKWAEKEAVAHPGKCIHVMGIPGYRDWFAQACNGRE